MTYHVAVRTLVEFTAKQGDLDLRFTPVPSAQEGIAGHAVVTSRRRAGYQTEVPLTADYKHLHVRGRADGYAPTKNRLEEIKTFRGDLSAMPDNHRQLHWAQLKIYGWLLCQQQGLTEVCLALVYFDIGNQKETVFSELHTAATLQQYFEAQCERFLVWSEQELAHRNARDIALASLPFPHASFRPGQRQLAEAVYRSACTGCCLMAEAPTGIGKTIGTIFPLLKASPIHKLDKLFFLAAKTSGRHLALEALTLIRNSAPALPLRVLELIARDKACEHPDKACHGESCPLAKGFYDRLPQARTTALAHGFLNKEALRTIAQQHHICPYYLSQDLARWCDVVVGDYNYYFDSSAMLHGLTATNEWRVGVLVDEAHNLVERARKMYTAELDQAAFRFLCRTAPDVLKKSMDRLHRCWNELNKAQESSYQVHAGVPDKLAAALQKVIAAITDYFADHLTQPDAGMQRFYLDALHFSRMTETFDTHSLFDITKDTDEGNLRNRPSGSILCIRNILPAPFLAPRFAAAHATTLFSATLSPWHYYSDTLGLPDNTVCVDVESPFSADQLQVKVVRSISTRYQHREQSLTPIVELMARQYAQQPGNYLAFFSSFDYLQKVSSLFHAHYPNIPQWEQTRRMDEHAREQFLARFTPTSQGIGFAVLGGAFGEGIDLPGQRLVGAFIATLGLPQLNPVNEQIMQRMNDTFGTGYDYTYLYP